MTTVEYIDPWTNNKLEETEEGLKDDKGKLYILKNGVFRVTGGDNYTSSFGFQWNKFPYIQLDERTSSSQSKDRFFTTTGWSPDLLENKDILEVGSGAGRFTSIILNHTKANLFSVDYSDSVEANYANNGSNSRLKLFQASIYELPFKPGSFDKVICFGVLQHTPDFKKSIQHLTEMVKEGGELVVDFYPLKGWYTYVHAKYLLRPFTKKLNEQRLLCIIESNIDWMLKTSLFFNKIGVGKIINRFIPICDLNTLPKNLSKKELREWAILDTFDMFSPVYDKPQRIEQVKNWFISYGMKNVWSGYIKYGEGNKAAVVKGTK